MTQNELTIYVSPFFGLKTYLKNLHVHQLITVRHQLRLRIEREEQSTFVPVLSL